MEERIISAVYQHQILYNTAHPEFKNIRKKDIIWDEVAATLDILGEEIKKRWKNLRDCYIKHLRSRDTHTKLLDRYRAWPWAQQMSIFKPFIKYEPSTSNIQNADRNVPYAVAFTNIQEGVTHTVQEIHTEPNVNYNVLESDTQAFVVPKSENIQEDYGTTPETNPGIQTIPVTENDTIRPRNKRKNQAFTSQASTSTMDKVLQYLNKNNKQEYDEVDLLCLSYAKTIKRFSLERQAIVKYRISKILMQEELAHLRECSVSDTAVK